MTEGDPAAAIAALRGEVAKRLLAAGLTIQAAARQDLSVGNPAPHDHPAPKGEFPRLRTGGGRANVAVEPATLPAVKQTLMVRVGYRPAGMHLYHLAARGWKGLADTLGRARARVAAVLGGGGP